MALQPEYRIHLADPLGLVDTPFIVTTAYAGTDGQPRSEWFLVIPEEKGLLFSQRSMLALDPSSDSRLVFDAELLLNEALECAGLRLRRYIQETRGDAAQQLLTMPTAMRPGDHTHLVKLWMRGAYCGSLSEIRAKSGCAPLIDTLIWIHGLPMLASNEL